MSQNTNIMIQSQKIDLPSNQNKNENKKRNMEIGYKDMHTYSTKMESHTDAQTIAMNNKIHNELIMGDYVPIPSSIEKGKRPMNRYVLAFGKEIKGYQKRYDAQLASDDNEIMGAYTQLSKDGHVGVLLDGKLALLDFDDEERPSLWKEFEKKFPFLKNAHKDKSPTKAHSYHYLIPDDAAFASQEGKGTITNAEIQSGIHLINPANLKEKYVDELTGLEMYKYDEENASVKVDFKKIYQDGMYDNDAFDHHSENDTFRGTKFATIYGGSCTPAYSTYSVREQIRPLPEYDDYVEVKDEESYTDFIIYMNTVFHARSKAIPKEVAEKKKEQRIIERSMPRPPSVQCALDFKRKDEECYNWIIEHFPSRKGFTLTWKYYAENNITMINLGREKAARKCPIVSRYHKSNNTYLCYYGNTETLYHKCYDCECSGRHKQYFYKTIRTLKEQFLEAANHRNFRKDENGDLVLKEDCLENCNMDMNAGKLAVARAMNKHICRIDGMTKTEYIRYGYGGGGYSRKSRDSLTQCYEDQEFFVQTYTKSTDANGHSEKVPAKSVRIDPCMCWLKMDFPEKMKRERIDFMPLSGWDDGGTAFNTFSGFTITKELAQNWVEHQEWSKNECMKNLEPLLKHILNIWCGSKETHYNYVLNWFAWCLQRPCEKTKVCLCVKSTTEGSGKGCVIDKIINIIGDQHAVSLEDFPTGFNEIIADKCFLNFDEATWGGKHGKNEDGVLKHFITERGITRKQKFKDDVKQSAYHNICISTNKAFFAPVDIGSRRYYCLELNNKYGGVTTEAKNAYFAPIWKVPNELFAWFLYNRDISDYNPRLFDTSDMTALKEAAMSGMGSVSSWWYNCLLQGWIYDDSYKSCEPPFQKIESVRGFDQKCCRSMMFKQYQDDMKGSFTEKSSGKFWAALKHHIPAEALQDVSQGTDRKRKVLIPPLKACRGWWKEGFRSLCKCEHYDGSEDCTCNIKHYCGTNITGWEDELAEAEQYNPEELEEILFKIDKDYQKARVAEKKRLEEEKKEKELEDEKWRLWDEEKKKNRKIKKTKKVVKKKKDPRPNLDLDITDVQNEIITGDTEEESDMENPEGFGEGYQGGDMSGY